MPDSTDPPSRSRNSDGRPTKSRLTASIGILIGIAGLGFAFYALLSARDELTSADLSLSDLAVAAIAGFAGMTVVGMNWLRIIRILEIRPKVISGLRWYFVGQLGKYIPGGLWAVLGRAELATRGGVARPISYASVAMSLITTYAAAATTGALFLALGSSSIESRLSWALMSAAIVGAATIGLSEPVVGRINRFAHRFGLKGGLPSASPRVSISAIVMTIPAWLAIGGATAAVAQSLGFSFSISQLIAATSYSWLAGFLVIPLPGGLGVREAVFIGLYAGPTQEAAAIAVVARIVFILVDLTGAGLATVTDRLRLRMAA